MKRLLILSGKGGTGKTTVAASFVRFAQAKAASDCDVDAPNLHLVFPQENAPEISEFAGGDKAVIDAQKCIGRDVTNGNTLTKAKHGMKILSIMTTWALENSVETADSMKSRGYGLRGRTNFSIYRFDTRDKWIFSVIAAADLIVLGGIVTKKVYFLYFPMMEGNPLNWETLLIYVIYGGMCMLPMVINIVEDIKWHYLKSEI